MIKKHFRQICAYSIVPFLSMSLGLSSRLFEPKIFPKTYIGPIDVGEVTKQDAKNKLAAWWHKMKQKKITLTSDLLTKNPEFVTPDSLGAVLDIDTILNQVKEEPLMSRFKRSIRLQPDESVRKIQPIFKYDPSRSKALQEFIEKNSPVPKPALVILKNRAIFKEYEYIKPELDPLRIIQIAWHELPEHDQGTLPLMFPKKKMPDEDIDKIQDVVSEFSTHLSHHNANRRKNIVLAAEYLKGKVLMPGDQFSFNRTTGKRTAAKGFFSAGTYRNGITVNEIGGGICQVSSTLYNAALLADLKIIKRKNHSMKVPYLPLGRDATVSYGSIDLIFENSLDTPIAIDSSYAPGTLTFRILGKKDPDKKVIIEEKVLKRWGPKIKYVVDASLAPGETKVRASGEKGGSVITYKKVLRYGKVVSNEVLNKSYYPGGIKIIAKGPASEN